MSVGAADALELVQETCALLGREAHSTVVCCCRQSGGFGGQLDKVGLLQELLFKCTRNLIQFLFFTKIKSKLLKHCTRDRVFFYISLKMNNLILSLQKLPFFWLPYSNFHGFYVFLCFMALNCGKGLSL